jgi:sulfoxide reductase heme-binding subunit YedZ
MLTAMKKTTPFQIVMHLAGWFPLAWLLFDFFTDNLTINPIQEIEQRLGRYALYFLMASLACTPLNTLFGWRELLKRRRALGLYAFMYAALHFAFFTAVDYGFDWVEIGQQLGEKPFIMLGLSAGIILLALAVTSFQWFMRQMGKGWQSLHRGIYLAAPIVIIHYLWSIKGDILTLQGNILKPVLLGLVVAALLLLRISSVRRFFANLRQRIAAQRLGRAG